MRVLWPYVNKPFTRRKQDFARFLLSPLRWELRRVTYQTTNPMFFRSSFLCRMFNGHGFLTWTGQRTTTIHFFQLGALASLGMSPFPTFSLKFFIDISTNTFRTASTALYEPNSRSGFFALVRPFPRKVVLSSKIP